MEPPIGQSLKPHVRMSRSGRHRSTSNSRARRPLLPGARRPHGRDPQRLRPGRLHRRAARAGRRRLPRRPRGLLLRRRRPPPAAPAARRNGCRRRPPAPLTALSARGARPARGGAPRQDCRPPGAGRGVRAPAPRRRTGGHVRPRARRNRVGTPACPSRPFGPCTRRAGKYPERWAQPTPGPESASADECER